MKAEFLDNAVRAQEAESVATIVGVNRGEDMYKKVSMMIKSICNCFISLNQRSTARQYSHSFLYHIASTRL